MAVIKSPDGITANVDADNRLTVFADVQSWEEHRNREASAYSSHFSVTPAGANDYFWYFRNDGTADIYIHKIRLASTVATEITIEHVTGTAAFVTGTTPSVTNKNLGNPTQLSLTNTFDTDITGLTSQSIIYFQQCAVADTMYTLVTASNIIVPQGQAIALKRVAATGLIDCQVSFVTDSGVVRGT